MSQSNAQRFDEADEPQQRPGRRPEHTAKVGNVEIAVWKNRGTNGDFYTASSPVIRYKDGATGEIKDGSSYGQLDLLALRKPRAKPAPRFASFQKAVAKAVKSPPRELAQKGRRATGGPFFALLIAAEKSCKIRSMPDDIPSDVHAMREETPHQGQTSLPIHLLLFRQPLSLRFLPTSQERALCAPERWRTPHRVRYQDGHDFPPQGSALVLKPPYTDRMSERSELLKAMAAAYALGDRAIPCGPEAQRNPVTQGLDRPAKALASLARYAVTNPQDPMQLASTGSPRSASNSDTCSYANGYRKYQRTAGMITCLGYCRPSNGLASVIGTASHPTKSPTHNFAMEPAVVRKEEHA